LNNFFISLFYTTNLSQEENFIRDKNHQPNPSID